MKWLKIVLYSIILLLLLELLKTFLSRFTAPSSYFLAVIVSCVQVLAAFGIIFYFLFFRLFVKFFHLPHFCCLVVFILFVSLAEILFIYWYKHPEKVPDTLKESYGFYYDFFGAAFIQYEPQKAVYDHDLFYRLKPNGNFSFSNPEFRTTIKTNSQGLRDDEESLIKPEIIVLGDSYAMGWGVEEPSAFPVVIEKLTGKKTLNAGTPSYGTARELLLLSKLDLSELRYLVIQYCSNDYMENEKFIDNNYKLAVSSADHYKSVTSTYHWTRKYFPGKIFLITIQTFIKSKINFILPVFPIASERINLNKDESGNAAHFADILYNSDLDFNKIKVIVTRLNGRNLLSNDFMGKLAKKIKDPPYQSRFGNVLTLLDLNPLLGTNDYFFMDVHLRPSGHQKIADTIAQLIGGIQ